MVQLALGLEVDGVLVPGKELFAGYVGAERVVGVIDRGQADRIQPDLFLEEAEDAVHSLVNHVPRIGPHRSVNHGYLLFRRPAGRGGPFGSDHNFSLLKMRSGMLRTASMIQRQKNGV